MSNKLLRAPAHHAWGKARREPTGVYRRDLEKLISALWSKIFDVLHESAQRPAAALS